jgi:hypothetical protein
MAPSTLGGWRQPPQTLREPGDTVPTFRADPRDSARLAPLLCLLIAVGAAGCGGGTEGDGGTHCTASTESCNGLDDDCDGQIDEDLGADPCSAGVGVCAASGTILCIGGQLICDATPGAAGVESCNGLDDDCDGLVDEEPEAGCPQPHLLISEVRISPTAQEFVEVYNPGAVAVDLSTYYLADFSGYYLVTQGTAAPIASDFLLRFPPGAQLPAQGFLAVSLESAAGFSSAFGVLPDFDLDAADPSAPDMLGTWTASSGLTDAAEMIVLFRWDGASPLVEDVDYVVYGLGGDRSDKSGVTIGGQTYASDTSAAVQVAAPVSAAYSTHRCDLQEVTEVTSAGNGLTGHDETSENGSAAWRVGNASFPVSTPRAPPPTGLCP